MNILIILLSICIGGILGAYVEGMEEGAKMTTMHVFGLLSVVLSLFIVVLYVYTKIYRLGITPLKAAHCKYDDIARDYIITVENVELCARSKVRMRNENWYILIKDSEEKYGNRDVYGYTVMQKGQSSKVDLQFYTAFSFESDIENSLLRKEKVDGRIIIGQCKSAWFPIRKVNIIRDGDITMKRKADNTEPPPLKGDT